MKKLSLLLCGMFLFLQMVHSQVITLASENFDGVVTFTATNGLSAGWSANTTYSVSAPNSYHGTIPTSSGDSIILTSPVYDFTGYENVRLSFDQICKVASSDIARIEYRVDQMGPMGAWKAIPTSAYTGSGKFANGVFSSSSYAIWDSTNNLATPTDAWWQTESFNLTDYVGLERAQIRFVLKKGNVAGTNFAYGWLLDNFKIDVSAHIVAPPTVEVTSASTKGRQIYNGPFPVFVKLESNTPAAMLIPNLQLKLTYEGNVTYDSLPLTLVSGSTYTANVGPYLVGTRIDYKVTGSDAYGNTAEDSSYIIVGREGKHFYWRDTVSTATTGYAPYYGNQVYSWARMLYLGSELRSGTITHLAWKCNTANTTVDSLYVWMQSTKSTTVPTGAYANPSNSGATLVWSGPITTKIGWIDLYLDTPFDFHKDSNLIITTAVTKHATKATTNWIRLSTTINNRVRYGYHASSVTSMSNSTSTSVPLLRLSFDLDSNDVLLNNIGPDYVMGGATPVQAMIQNLGLNNLTSATISWSVNGVQQPDYNWTGNLAEGYKDTVTIGNYMPTARDYDTIKVWVHTPNGVNNDTSRLTKRIFGCNGANPISGVFTVGSDPSNDFTNVAAALNFFKSCGVAGDIELALTDSVIEERWDFSNIGAVWGNNRLIIRSAANNADSTILRPNLHAANVAGVIFNNSHNITLKYLTIDGNSTKFGTVYPTSGPIRFNGSASNINISYCKLIAKDTSAISGTGWQGAIRKATSTGVLNNVRIDHNEIRSGYYGLYINAGTANNYGLVYIDSNEISNIYGQAIYLYYANPFVRGNRSVARTAHAAPWMGIHCTYGSYGEICNNHIQSLSSGRAEGIQLGQLGSASTPILVANNEVSIYSTTTDNGISTNTNECHIDIINNSIFVMGTALVRGIQVTNYAASTYTIRNNNIVGVQNMYPLYLPAAMIPNCDVANNNQWTGGSYWGWIGTNITTEAAWKGAVPSEENVTRIRPSYKDTSINLELNNVVGLECPRFARVRRDINDKIRPISTIRGAYGKPLDSLDLALVELQGWSIDSIGGTQSDIKVELYNNGVATITSANLTWEFNGVQQTYTYNGILPTDSSVVIPLGTITYVASINNVFTVWIDAVNGGMDNDQANDTLTTGASYICPGIYVNDTVYVGASRAFTTGSSALERLNYCGIQGNITILYDDGTYVEDMTISSLKGMTAQDTIFIASASGNRSAVTILRADDASATYLGIGTVRFATDNVVVKNLTISAARGDGGNTYNVATAVSFAKACSNIEIDNCILAGVMLSSVIKDTAKFDVIYDIYAINNFRVHDCLLSGGSNSVFISAAADNISIVNNQVVNFDVYGLYFNRVSNLNVEGNTVSQRNNPSITPESSMAICAISSNGRIVGNRTSSVKADAAIKVQSFNTGNVAPDTNGLIANNEILMDNGRGIDISGTSYVNIVNNSIFKKGSAAYTFGLYFDYLLPNMVNVFNNNVVLKSSATDYPLFIRAQASLNSDYNNYYSTSGHIALIDSVSIDSLTALQASTGADNHSVSVSPIFFSEGTTTKLLDYTNLSCPTYTSVPTDIEGVNRSTLTAKGAYHIESPNTDVAIVEITEPTSTGALSGVPTDIKVKIYNAGVNTLTSVTFNWKIDSVWQTPYTWSGRLAPKITSTDITIGNFIPTGGYVELTVVADSANGASPDDRPSNDTISKSVYSCIPAMRGTYLVDASNANADFANLQEAVLAMLECGIDSSVVIELNNATEQAVNIVRPILGASDTNTVLITSHSGNAADVTINGEMKVGDVAHLTLSNLSFNSAGNYKCINLSLDCEDIEISNCILRNTASKTADITGGNGCICSPATITLNNLRIYNNEIHGSFHGINLAGQNSTIDIKGNTFYDANYANIVIDSALATIDSNIFNGINTLSGDYNYFSVAISNVDSILVPQVTNNVFYMPKKSGKKSDNTERGVMAIRFEQAHLLAEGNTIYAENELGENFYAIYTPVLKGTVIRNNKIYVNNAAYANVYGITMGMSGAFSIGINGVTYRFYPSEYYHIEGNTIEERNCPNLANFYGIQTTSVTISGIGLSSATIALQQADIIGNRFWMSDVATTNAYGVNIITSNSGGSALFYNNEFAINSANVGRAVSYTNAPAGFQFLHNSIKTTNTAGTGYGLYLPSATKGKIYHNNIEASGVAYPIYLSGTTTNFGANGLDIDYNNIYGTDHVGYAGDAAQNTLADWKSVVTSDIHSVSIKPIYVDSVVALKVSDTADFYCHRIASVPTDILGNLRYGQTVMGAYSCRYNDIDLALSDVFNIKAADVTIGNNVTPEIEVYNLGGVPITSATINWTYNGVLQQPINWTGNINSFEKDTVAAPAAVTIGGGFIDQEFVFWISDVNQGGKDSIAYDDTLSLKYFLCDSALNGIYTVGPNGDFTTLASAVNRIRSCGMSGDVTLALSSGIYTDKISFTTALPGQDTCTLTITKDMNDPMPVILQPTSGAAITLNAQRNLVIDSLHIDITASGATSGIQFTGACTTIVISNCIFEGKSADGTAANSGIYKASSTGILNDVRIVNNHFIGGNTGVYLYLGTGTSAFANNMHIDSNLFEGQYSHGAYFYYGAMTFDNNIVKTDATSSTTWIGVRLYSVNSHVRNNRIMSTAVNMATGYGMYIYNMNRYLATGAMDMVNNEIILKSTAATAYGIYMNYCGQTNVMFNSIYMASGTVAARGMYIYNLQARHTIMNNNIVMTGTGTTAYAVYMAASMANVTIDYNNYYSAGTNKAYFDANKTTIAAIQTTTGQDASSVIKMPTFIDSVNVPVASMALVDADGMACIRDARYPNDINDNQREYVTAMGCYSAPTSDKVDFEIVEVIQPTHFANLCSPDYVSVQVAVKSLSGVVVDFANIPLKLTVQMSGMNTCTIDTIISQGMFRPMQIDTFEITSLLPVAMAGDYYLTVSSSSVPDTVYTNDTLSINYRTSRMSLPYDEDFSTTASLVDLTIDTLMGTNGWNIEIGNNIGYIDPVFGTGKIGFGGPLGSVARLSTAQLEIYKTSQPTFEFWYAHDTSHANANDQTDVKVTFDGGQTYHVLMNLKRYDANITAPEWRKYSIDLSPYTDSACVVISFEALSYGGESQYIDRIAINAVSNVALTDIITPNIDACSQPNGTLGVELTNVTTQAINFASTPTSVIVEVTGDVTATYTYTLDTGILASLEVDTLEISNSFNYAPGTYVIKAYISPAIDNTTADDTVSTTLTINPDLTVVAQPTSSQYSCVIVGAHIVQDVTITNSGNIDMEDLILVLEISNSSGSVVETLTDTIFGVTSAGTSINYMFKNFYTVPNDYQYNVSVSVYPMCNPSRSFQSIVNECIDLNDLAVDGILVPANNGTCSKIGDSFAVKVKVSNKNPNEDANNVDVYAEIVDNNGTLLMDWTETVSINADNYEEVEFAPFTVPSVASFTVNAYLLNNNDINRSNDTAAPVTKCTDLGISNANANNISMSQNIPNPANGKTSVNYTIPEDGKVIFNIMTVTGQILYTEEVSAMSGDNRIEFNTESMASGIYFYTMTYNGQRIVKKMTIEK